MTWRNKYFWLLGFLAAFWGDIGTYQAIDQVVTNFTQDLPPFIGSTRDILQTAKALSPQVFAVTLAWILLIGAALLALVILVTAARGGLLIAIEERKRGRKLTVKRALKQGLKAAAPLLVVGLITRLDIFIYLLALNRVALDSPSGGQLLVYTLLFVVVTLISLLLSLLGIYASAYIMLAGASLKVALINSLTLFRSHWLVSLEFALIMYLVSVMVGLGVLLSLLVVGIPFTLLAAILTFLKIPAGLLIIGIPALIFYVLFILLVGSWMVAFQYTAWTLLYLRLHQEEGALAKVVRLTARFGHILHRKIV